MIRAYTSARKKFGNELPNPQEILNNKDEHIKKYIEYIGMVLKSTSSEEELMQILDNEYSNYIGIVADFDYKNILQMIKSNVNNSNLDDNHVCNDNNCNHKQLDPIPENIEQQLVDEDYDNVNNVNDINSDDEII